MLSLGQRGIAPLVVVVAVGAAAAGGIGTPVVVDTVADQQPDGALYGLERAGETIKELTFAGGQGWEIGRGKERTSEFVNMADKGKAEDYTGLLDEAGERFDRAIESADDVEGLQMAQDAVNRHISVLENVREKVPDEAEPAISLAISRSARGATVIAEVAAGKSPAEKLAGTSRRRIRNQLGNIRQEVRALRDKIRENLERGMPASEIIQNIEFDTANNLAEKAQAMANENKGEYISAVFEKVQNRIDAASNAAVDNTGLERAIEASKKHLAVLENVYEKVPYAAKPAISLAIERCLWHAQVLENIKENGILPGGTIPEQIREMFRERLSEIKENTNKLREQIRNRIEEAARNVSEVGKIVEEYENRWQEMIGRGHENRLREMTKIP